MTTLEWELLEPPLSPVAVLARGEHMDALAKRTRSLVDAGAELLVADRPGSWLLVLGASDQLPWAPEVTYLAEADGLLHPTTRRPAVPRDLLHASLSRSLPEGHHLVVVLEDAVLATRRPRRPPGPAQLRDPQ